MPVTQAGKCFDDVGMMSLDFDAAWDNWPAFPFLPLKHVREKDQDFPGTARLGFIVHPSLVEDPSRKFAVLHGNICMIGGSTAQERLDFLKAMPFTPYETLGEIYAVGWRVD